MLLQQRHAFGFIACLHAEQYGAMFGLGLGAVDPIHVDPADKANACVDVLKHAQHFGIVRHAHQPLMKGLVELDQFNRAAFAWVGPGVTQEGEQRVDVLVADALDGKAHRVDLDRLTQLIKIEDLLGIQFAAEKSPARRETKKAFGVQPVQGFAQRRAADAEPAGNGALIEALARLELETHSHRLELFINAVDDAVGDDLRVFGHG